MNSLLDLRDSLALKSEAWHELTTFSRTILWQDFLNSPTLHCTLRKDS